MTSLLNGLKSATNYGLTENGGVKHNTSGSALIDLFGLGGAYRSRSESDCISLFLAALKEDREHAMKCLFYLRDIRGGQGERRFFRVCMRYLAMNEPEVVVKNIDNFAYYGRWDDLYCLFGTPCEQAALAAIKEQLAYDVTAKTPSLLAKWMKSENASSKEGKALAEVTRRYLKMSSKQYRKTLSYLRKKISIVERLMSENRWNEIEFDKLPSKAGIKYRKAFERNELIKQQYQNFARDKNTKVNAGTLYPYEVVKEAVGVRSRSVEDTQRLMVNKYWENLTDFFNGATLNALCVVDVSGSMTWTPLSPGSQCYPIHVAISMGLYTAERAKGPFANHFITFSNRPSLVEVKGHDIVSKVDNIYRADVGGSTNLEATFDLILNTAVTNRLTQEDLPETIIIVSDMEINDARGYYSSHVSSTATLMENMRVKWANWGYKMPKLVYWNCQARNDTILDIHPDVTLVSGNSPVIYQQILTGKSGLDLVLDKLDSERYNRVRY